MRALQLAVGSAVLFAWLASLVDGFITEDYHAFDVSTPVMLVVSGFLFGDQFLKKRIEHDQR